MTLRWGGGLHAFLSKILTPDICSPCMGLVSLYLYKDAVNLLGLYPSNSLRSICKKGSNRVGILSDKKFIHAGYYLYVYPPSSST